ncbi:MAG: hypothetical protein ACRDJE_13750 [Dehalococcoidia bacterium]
MAGFAGESLFVVLVLAGIAVIALGTMLMVGRRRTRPAGQTDAGPPSAKDHVAASSAAAAALAQRITGPGSGPYSGTPFPAAQRTAGGGLHEHGCHERGIIDHNRHVSSIGRR